MRQIYDLAQRSGWRRGVGLEISGVGRGRTRAKDSNIQSRLMGRFLRVESHSPRDGLARTIWSKQDEKLYMSG
jgi:hypothetical protein